MSKSGRQRFPRDLFVFYLIVRARGFDADDGIASARLYGNVAEYAYYFVDLLVGYPPQRVSVIVDTASKICGFPCKRCTHCGNHIDDAFEFNRSLTAKWLTCSSGADRCDSCTESSCSYQQRYAEGSSIAGSWFQDYVRLGDDFQENPPSLAHLGCHETETRLFYTQKANGILGMAPGSSSVPTILEEIFEDDKVHASIFALCFAQEGGLLTVGGIDTSYHLPGATVLWVPLHVGSEYSLSLQGMSLDGSEDELLGDFGTTIVDSGTTYTYLPDPLYVKLHSAIVSFCDSHDRCGATSSTGACWQHRKKGVPYDNYPTVRFRFESGTMLWKPRAYLYRKDTGVCLGIASNGGTKQTVLGATWMINTNVIFDIDQKRLGVAEASCPEFTQRPPPPGGLPVDSDGKRLRQSLEGSPLLFIVVVLFVLAASFGIVVLAKHLRAAEEFMQNGMSQTHPHRLKPIQELFFEEEEPEMTDRAPLELMASTEFKDLQAEREKATSCDTAPRFGGLGLADWKDGG